MLESAVIYILAGQWMHCELGMLSNDLPESPSQELFSVWVTGEDLISLA